MLVHICCSVDSHYFLSEIKNKYPNDELIGFFYNPNIHPKSEHDLRLSDVHRSCELLGIKLIEGHYNVSNWMDSVVGLELEPEKGARCSVCFDVRLEVSAKLAKSLGKSVFTTTLLCSPKKDIETLFAQGDFIAKKYGLEFLKIDLRVNGGTQKQNILAKEARLYRQNYCGCMYALQAQRQKQNKISLEMFSNISKQILPASIEHKCWIFSRRDFCEKNGVDYSLSTRREKVWRLLYGRLKFDDVTIDSYIVVNSETTNCIGTIRWAILDRLSIIYGLETMIGYCDECDGIFVLLDCVNLILETNYKSVSEMVKNPPTYGEELKLRGMISATDTTFPLIVIDKMLVESVNIDIVCIFQEEAVFDLVEVDS